VVQAKHTIVGANVVPEAISGESQRMQRIFGEAQQSAPPATVGVPLFLPVGTPAPIIIKDNTVTIGTFSFNLQDPFDKNPRILQVLSEIDKEWLNTIRDALEKKSHDACPERGGGMGSNPYADNLKVIKVWYHRRFDDKLLLEYKNRRKQTQLSTPHAERLSPTYFDSEIDMEWLATNTSTRDVFLACFDEIIAKLVEVEKFVEFPLDATQEAQEVQKDTMAQGISVKNFIGKLDGTDFDEKSFTLLLQHGTIEQLNELQQLFDQVVEEKTVRAGKKRLNCPKFERRLQRLWEWKSLRTGLESIIQGKCSNRDSLLKACDFSQDPEMTYIRRHASEASQMLLIASFRSLRGIVQENKNHFEGLKKHRVYVSDS
jgi:hypothetical protein